MFHNIKRTSSWIGSHSALANGNRLDSLLVWDISLPTLSHMQYEMVIWQDDISLYLTVSLVFEVHSSVPVISVVCDFTYWVVVGKIKHDRPQLVEPIRILNDEITIMHCSIRGIYINTIQQGNPTRKQKPGAFQIDFEISTLPSTSPSNVTLHSSLIIPDIKPEGPIPPINDSSSSWQHDFQHCCNASTDFSAYPNSRLSYHVW